MMDEDKSLSEKNYRSILLRLKPEMFEEFIRPFYYCREELQLAILDVISMKKEVDYLVFLESIFEKYDGEIKLRALKAISSIGYVRNIEEYLFLTKSKKWQERMMVAKLLGSYEEQHLYLLITLLHDSSWWVRSQAAESIINFKKGRAILLEIIKHSKDTFAQDMAREWLNKGVN
ncbi:HEAT repeat domain-containing protein [Niallia sp. FSL W8-0635]|uniref:HEAT repeat domain-containing protein n=1 Tax=Niallia sp. FSL W8-0635 TaxID=2975337 RepID=UPI0030FAB006